MKTFPVLCLSLLGVAGLAAFSVEAPLVQPASALPAVWQQSDSTKVKTAKQRKSRKEKAPAAAKITMKREVSRATIMQQSAEGTSVEVEVRSQGMKVPNLEDLQLLGSSGSPVFSSSYNGFDNVSFPFEGYVRFKASNKLGTAVYDREVRFKVNEPGRWTVRVDL